MESQKNNVEKMVDYYSSKYANIARLLFRSSLSTYLTTTLKEANTLFHSSSADFSGVNDNIHDAFHLYKKNHATTPEFLEVSSLMSDLKKNYSRLNTWKTY